MTNKELLYIITAFDEGSFLYAAKKLFISQSALSQSIRKIESELSMELFTNLGNRIMPTDACKHLVEIGRPLLNSWQTFEKEMSLYSQKQQATLVVGMNAFMTKYFRPYISQEFSRRFPNIKAKYIEDHSGVLNELVQTKALDLCLMRRSRAHPNLENELLFASQLLLAVPKNHPFAISHPYKGLDCLETVSLSELRNEPFAILKSTNFGSSIINPLFEEAGFQPNIYAESYTWDNIKDFVKCGYAVALLDEMMVSHFPDDDYISYYLLDSNRKYYGLSAVYRPYNRMPSHVRSFLEVAKGYRQHLINK